MKTYYFILLFIFTAFLSEGCGSKNSFDYSFVLVPQSATSSATTDDLDRTAQVINKRLLSFFNIPAENIKSEVKGNEISFTIRNIDTIKISQIRKVITGYSRLEFWETYENSEITGSLKSINDLLKGKKGLSFLSDTNSMGTLFSKMKPMVDGKGELIPGCMIGLVNLNDTSAVSGIMKTEQVRALLPADIRFIWSARPYRYDKSDSTYGLHAIKVTTANGQAPLDGSVIVSAKTVEGSGSHGVKIGLSMNTEGTRKWAEITKKNISRCIAVVYEGKVRSYPRVQSEITGGNTEITGDFTAGEADDLVKILQSGEMPFKIRISGEQVTERK